jgi:hypothetical protein
VNIAWPMLSVTSLLNRRRILRSALRRWDKAVPKKSEVLVMPDLCPLSPGSLSELAFFMEEDDIDDEEAR